MLRLPNNSLSVPPGLKRNSWTSRKIRKALGHLCVGIFSQVEPDSGIHIVNQGANLGRDLRANCLVSVGGGSCD